VMAQDAERSSPMASDDASGLCASAGACQLG
jgi:hypothetical protein